MTEIVTSLTMDSLRALLQRFGFRAEVVTDEAAGVTLLRSATSGLGFDIRPGNRLADRPAEFLDCAFLATFRVEGELPPGPLNDWNNARRFSRLHINQGFLLLDMDVSVAGGVTIDHLRAHLEIFDQLLQGLVAFLRAELPRLAANDAAASALAPQAATQTTTHTSSATTVSVG
jgi:hypothetical protein